MNSTELSSLRKAVLDIYPRYVTILDEIDSGSDTKLLDQRVKFLKEDKFMLAVVGESKSGKSKFINGLIGKELLPTDVLQCTSGIVEIYKSSQPSIRINYASGREDTKLYKDNSILTIMELKNTLAELAAIPEQYRSIPFVQINDFLIKTNGEVKLQEVEQEIQKWSEFILITPQSKEVIYTYINEYKNLDKIPLSIRIGYPLEFDFQQMSIVDTPGVNARGGIETVTFEYIDTANAIVFIHTLKNIDSNSLYSFFKRNLPKRNAKNIFLFLTHKSLHSTEDIEKVLLKAQTNFPEILPGRILAVDSMLKLIYHDFLNGNTIKDIRQDEEKKKIIADYVIELNNDEEKIKSAIFTDSNFKIAFNTINDFSNQARFLQIEEITESIFADYTQYEAKLKEDIRLRQSKLTKTPKEFEQEITDIQNNLETYRDRLVSFTRQLSGNFKGKKDLIEFKNNYFSLIDNANSDSEIRKILIDFKSDCDGYIDRQSNEISSAYSNEVSKLGAEIQQKHITPPNIDLSKIEDEAKSDAYELIVKPIYQLMEDVYVEASGFWGGILSAGKKFIVNASSGKNLADGLKDAFREGREKGLIEGKDDAKQLIDYEYENVFSQVKYLNNLKNTSKGIIVNTTDQLSIILEDYFDSYDKKFTEQLNKLIDERTKSLQDLLSQKKSEDQIRGDINILHSQLNHVLEERKKVTILKKDLVAALQTGI